jgi:polysaccharide pyruvyl transferase WcaK-like protein
MFLKKHLLKSKKLCLLTLSGYNNVGQEMMISGFLNEIKNLNLNINIFANSNNPNKSKNLHPEIFFIKSGSLSFVYNLFFSDTVIFLGDEITTSNLDKYYNWPKSLFEGKFRIFMYFLSILLKKKCFFYKVGLYSIPKHYPIKILSYVINNSSKIYVRDLVTRNLISTFLFDKNHKKLILSNDLSESINFSKYNHNIKKARILGVALSHIKSKKSLHNISLIIKKEAHKYSKIVFFIFSKHPILREENDIYATKKLISSINLNDLIFEIFYSSNYRDYFKKMNEVDKFISMRYHGIKLSQLLNKNYIILGNSPKIKSFLSK